MKYVMYSYHSEYDSISSQVSKKQWCIQYSEANQGTCILCERHTQYLLSFLSLGVLNPLDTPHHMKIDDDAPFREGVVLNRPVKVGGGSFVNAGMRKEVRIDKALKPGLRVTVKLGEKTGMCSFEHFKFTLSAIIKAMLSLETREKLCAYACTCKTVC